MWLQVCIFLFLIRQSHCMDTYYVDEEEPPETFVGDIANSLPQQDKSNIVFEMLQGENINLFHVTKDGRMYTLQKLDAENLCSYNTECFRILDVTIKSGGIVKYVKEIKIIINDIDDHKPIFPVSEVILQFSEADGKGMKKPISNAVDKDISVKNSEIKYEINKVDDAPFSLDISKKVDGTSQLKIVLDERLDRERKNIHVIQVIAKGSKSSEEESILKIKIDVLDFNDNPPVFTQKMYNFSIGNTVQINMLIASVSATDADSGVNSKIVYHFSPKTSKIAESYFKLNEESGEIFLNEQISEMKQRKYQLYIEATDGGNPALSSVVLVWVFVTNQKNNAPRITVTFLTKSTSTLTIPENQLVDSFLAYVKITDNDKGKDGDVHCGIKHEYFDLKNTSKNRYTLALKNKVDREKVTSMEFRITCADKGFPPLTTVKRFSVKITDINDVPPQFTKKSFTFITYENEDKGFPIGFVNVSDPDLGPGGEVSYFLISETNRNFPFHISNFGFISTTESLDREQCSIYHFKVLAKDNGTPSLNSTVNITVEIVDKNDNAPYFTFPSGDLLDLVFDYYPDSSNDITLLRASDRDSHVNSFLKYEIRGGNDKQLFKVNPYSGLMSFSRRVNQNDVGSYSLELVVKDSGTPILSATTTLSMTLTVSNRTKLTASAKATEHGININLFIIIIVAAVIVSLVLVISITLCIVKRNDQRNLHYSTVINSPRKYHNTNKHIECFHKQIPQSDTPVTMPVMCRRQSLPGFQSDHNWSDPGIHYHTLKEGRPKINIQRTTTSPDTAGDKETKFTSPYCYSDLSTISYADSGRGYSEGYATHYEELPDPYPRRQEHRPEEETPKRDNTPTPQMDTNTGTMPCSNLPGTNVDMNSDETTKLKSFSSDSTFQQLPLKNSFSSTNKPLPAIPNAP